MLLTVDREVTNKIYIYIYIYIYISSEKRKKAINELRLIEYQNITNLLDDTSNQ